MHYQYLVVGAGLYGAVFAHEMEKRGKDCLVIEKRDHIAGNIYTKEVNGSSVFPDSKVSITTLKAPS